MSISGRFFQPAVIARLFRALARASRGASATFHEIPLEQDSNAPDGPAPLSPCSFGHLS
jgi:hypothetical protein